MCSRTPPAYPEKIKLAAVKRSIFNPYQPSFRSREADAQVGKMSGDQRVTTLPLGVDRLPSDNFREFFPSSHYALRHHIVLPQPPDCVVPTTKTQEDEEVVERMKHLEDPSWAACISRVPYPEGRIVGLKKNREMLYGNYCVRSLKPEFLTSWRRLLTSDIQDISSWEPSGHVTAVEVVKETQDDAHMTESEDPCPHGSEKKGFTQEFLKNEKRSCPC